MALASKIKIEIAGNEIKDFLRLKIKQSIYGFNEFEVVCRLDTFELDDSFVINKSKKFIGAPIIITIDIISIKNITSAETIIFKGLITNVKGIKSGLSLSNEVVFKGKSPEILLKDLAGSRSFENKNLKQIVDEVLKPYPRDLLKSKVNPKLKLQFEYTVQHEENSYKFLRRLAKRFGEWMYYDGSEFVFGELSGSKTDLIIGVNQSDFNFDIKLNPTNFKYHFRDYIKDLTLEKLATKSVGKKQLSEPGLVAHDKSVKHFSFQPKLLINHLNVAKEDFTKQFDNIAELQENAQASKMSSVKGVSQNPLVKLGGRVNIKAIKTDKKGKVDYGEFIITSVTHTCDNMMNYKNKFKGISAEATIPDYTDPKVFPVSTSQSAIVTDNKDPENLGRVRVRFFWQDKGAMSPWIRSVNPYSANNRGFYFIPEIGDEVLVEYEGGDAEKPYVVGSLYHGKNKPHTPWPNNDNSFKGIVTRSNLRIEFNEKKKVTTIDTPGGNKIVLSDDEQSILLSDQNSNTVELSPSGINLNSPSDINIKSEAKITIEGEMGIDTLSSTGKIKIEGVDIQQLAQSTFEAKAGATAELSATTVTVKGDAQATIDGGASTTVKGAVVMIN
jgi:uncharacterized protein involved in type VI secretion and phage assembly